MLICITVGIAFMFSRGKKVELEVEKVENPCFRCYFNTVSVHSTLATLPTVLNELFQAPFVSDWTNMTVQ